MFAEFFAKSPVLAFPIISLVIFIVVFGAVLVRALGKQTRELAAVAEKLPLADDDHPILAPAMVRAGSDVQEACHE